MSEGKVGSVTLESLSFEELSKVLQETESVCSGCGFSEHKPGKKVCAFCGTEY